MILLCVLASHDEIMINQKNTAILIPARLAATRLPNKPLELIDNQPMIIHVWKRAIGSSLGKVVVATDSEKIAKLIKDENKLDIKPSIIQPVEEIKSLGKFIYRIKL